MRAIDAWAPVVLPDGLPGPMGVLVCLDVIYREIPRSHALVQAAPFEAIELDLSRLWVRG